MQLHKYVLPVVIATMAVTGTQAQVVNDIDTLTKSYDLAPVAVRALRAGSDAPFAKTEVSRIDIAKQNLGVDLPILLQFTPSAVTTSDAGAGVGYTGMRIRGTDATRINVTLNGIPVNDAESQGVFFVNFPDISSSLSSIQIQRGVGTSTNGGSAFGATMSLSNLQQFDKAGATFSSSYGSFNTFKNTLMAGTGLLKGGWQFDVRLSKVTSDGYIQRSASDLKSMQFIAGWQASENTSFKFLVMTGTEKTQQAWNGVSQDSINANRTYNELGLKSDGTYYNNQTDNYRQDYYQLFADHKFSSYLTGHVAGFLTRGIGYYEEYKTGEDYAKYGLPNFVTGTDTITSTDLVRRQWLDNYYYGGVFSLMYERNNTQLTLGGSAQQYDGKHYGNVIWAQNGGITDNYEYYNNFGQKKDANIYLKAQRKFNDGWIAYADVQYRHVNLDMDGFEDNPTLHPVVNYNFFNPKAGLTWLIRNTATERQKAYASVAISNREPNRNDFEASPTNMPTHETLYDGEAGYEISKRKWSIGANAYYMYYKNQLVLTGQMNDVGAYTKTNVPTSYRAGIELQGAIVPLSWLKVQANATFSQNKIDNFTEYLDNYDDGTQAAIAHGTTDISFSPNAIAAGTLTFTPFHNMAHGQNLEISLTEKYVGKQYLDNTSDATRMLDAYSYCNVLVRYVIPVRPFKEVSATLLLNNIFDQKYSNNGAAYPYIAGGMVNNANYYFPQAGFNVLGGITLKW